jgi:hypothetical protein
MNILSQSNTSIGATPLTGIAQDFIGERRYLYHAGMHLYRRYTRYGASPLSSSRPPPVKKQMPNTGMIGLPQLPAPDTSPSSRLPSFTLPSSYSQLHGHSSSMHNPVDSTGARSNFISSQIEHPLTPVRRMRQSQETFSLSLHNKPSSPARINR